MPTTQMQYYTKETIEKANAYMNGRGSKKGYIGYNHNDFMKCRHYFNGFSNTLALDVSKRLVKYCGKQLKLEKELLENTISYLEKHIDEDEKGQPVTVAYGEKYTGIGFNHNPRFVQAIKAHATDKRYVEKEQTWVVRTDETLKVLAGLQMVGAETRYARTYIEEQIKKASAELKVENHGRYIELYFDPNDQIENAIQSLYRHSYDKEKRSWLIQTKDISTLIEVLKNTTLTLDCTPLEELLPKSIPPNFISVKEVDRLTIEVSFAPNPTIVEALKTLTYQRKVDRYDHTRWTIPKFRISKFVKQLPNSIDTSELIQYAPKPIKKQVLNPNVYKQGSITPFNYQIEAAEFLLTRKKALLADEQGTGKTISSILASLQVPGKKLVVCPASLKYNWEDEIKMIDPEAQTVVINGSKWKECEGWSIINYDILDRHIEAIQSSGFRVGIYDEAHFCRAVQNDGTPGTKRAKAFINTTDLLEYVFILTGTPIMNKVKDIYNILRAIDHPVSYCFSVFAHRYCGAKRTSYGWNFDGRSNSKELHRLIKPYMLRRLKKDVLNLPKKVRKFQPVQVNLESYYKEIELYMAQKPYLSDDMAKLVELSKARQMLALAKLPYTIAYTKKALEKGKSVVIFTNYTEVIDKICETFGDISTRINGQCSHKQRRKAVQEFQAGEKKVIACNYIAAAAGVTLTASHLCIKQDLEWLPAMHMQAEDRIDRIGQTQEPYILYLYTEAAIEKIVVNSLKRKLDGISMVIDGEETEIYNEIAEELNKAVEEELSQRQTMNSY